MNTKLYIGNLNFSTTENDLQDTFAKCGGVTSVNLIMDRMSGQSKGFGFIEMPSEDEAKAAIQALHGTALKGRTLNVNEARPRADGGGGGRDRRGGPGGGRGGPGGGRGGYQ